MIDIKPTVVAEVNAAIAESGYNYSLYWLSPKKDNTLPCMVYNEIENNDYARVCGVEYANITIQFTNYSVNPEHIFMMASLLDDVMVNSLGFEKTYTGPGSYNSGVYTQVLRFNAIINHNLKIFNN